MTKVPVTPKGLIYLLCFLEAIGNGTDRGKAKHYTGFTTDLEERLEEHRAGRGARLTQVLTERGIGWVLADVHPGNQDIERLLKQHSATRRCPVCAPGAKRPQIVERAIAAAARKEAREARRAQGVRAIVPGCAPPQGTPGRRVSRPPVDPFRRGTEMAQRFMRAQLAAARTAGQIEATHDYITGPWRAEARHRPDPAETFRGYTELVAAG